VFGKSGRRDGTFSQADFRYDLRGDSYVRRPRNRYFAQGRGDVGQNGFIRYRARQEDCAGCHLWHRCTLSMPAIPLTLVLMIPARSSAEDEAMYECGEIDFDTMSSIVLRSDSIARMDADAGRMARCIRGSICRLY